MLCFIYNRIQEVGIVVSCENMDCCNPIPKPELSDTIVDFAAKYFGIEDDKEKCNLKLFFDFYSEVKMKEKVTKAFQRPELANN